MAGIILRRMAVSSVAGKKLWTRGVAAAILLQMDAYRREVGARLRGLRRSRNWSQEDAAHAVGVTSSAWGRWERGITSPYESNWQRIAEVFGDEEAREARGRPPAPLALGEGNGDPDRLTALEALIGGLDEQLRALDARIDQIINKLEESKVADQLPAIEERLANKIDAADSLNEGRAQEVRQRIEEGFAAIEDLLRRRRRA